MQLAAVLEEIANLLEIKGENAFKIRAYRRGAQAVSLLPEPVSERVEDGTLMAVDGIGKALAAKIEEWVRSGEMEYHQKLLEEFPRGLVDVMQVPGIGPKLARRLFDELDVRSIADLRNAVQKERLESMAGIGSKTQDNIARGLAQMENNHGRTPIGEALPVAVEILKVVQGAPSVTRSEIAGSLRRRAETVGDLDIVAAAEDPEEVMNRFIGAEGVTDVLAHGSTKSSVVLQNGLQVDLRVVSESEYASALHHFTGSKDHNVRLRELAQKVGYSISEYGLKNIETGETIHPPTEAELYDLLGLPFISPELREGWGEIEAAADDRLPVLLRAKDLCGDLHVHSTWSDGRSELGEIARAAQELGWEYVAICDHSRALRIAGGLNASDLRRQADAIDEAMDEVPGVRLLRGVEVDILADGSLDLDDDILSELDIVVASVHSGLRQDGEKMTNRIVEAIKSPHVDIIGHPTGRILQRRGPSDFDIDQIISAAVTYRTALEINASPDRLDLKDTLAKRAGEAGATLVVNTDAHDVTQFSYIKYGVSVARRAWLSRERVLNSRSLDDVLAWCRQDS